MVEKISTNDRTQTEVQEVTGLKRETEVARMLGGGELTPTIRKTAKELLKRGSGSAQ